MNARRRTMVNNPPKKIKNSGSTPGGANQASTIKNTKPAIKDAGYKVPRNSVSCSSY